MKTSSPSRSLSHARLDWQNQVPVALDFDDIYFNREGGAAETEHVFIRGNQLAERFAACRPHTRFVIAETGFGTGLNFLCTRQLWLNSADSTATLQFISFEKHPIRREDLEKLYAAWPEFSPATDALLAGYPAPQQGYHSLVLDQGRIRLTLILGDLLEMLPTLDTQVDAWFLDGFAPARNPDMWQDSLYRGMARLSVPGTTLATFTVAREVRDGLSRAGFSLHKMRGFGRKREMLCGVLNDGAMAPSAADQPEAAIWFSRRHQPVMTRPERVIVIGAGLAGATTARALADRGIPVTLLERNAAPAQAGSGNPQGALYAKLAATPTAHSDFHLAGFLHATRLLAPLAVSSPQMASLCGVLQLGMSDRECERQQAVIAQGHYSEQLVRWVDQQAASHLAGTEVGSAGLFFPTAGWVSPPAFCHWLLTHPAIELITQCQVTTLTRQADGWQVLTADQQRHHASTVVVCGAAEAAQLTQLSHLPLKPIRGQTSFLQAADTLPRLNTVVCGEGYISPALADQFCFGASFNLHSQDSELTRQDHQENLDRLIAALPGFARLECEQITGGRVGFRCTTPDYLPVVGPVPVAEAFLSDYAKLRDDANWRFTTAPSFHTGLYVNAGHGAKGLITCPLSAELLAAQLLGEPLPLEKPLCDLVHPARFLIKRLIKNLI